MKNETEKLNEAIIVLQEKRAMDLIRLKDQWQTTYEGYKPVNLIKKGLMDIVSASDVKGNIISNVMGIGAGIISKKLWVGTSHSPVKKLFGTLLQFAVANIVSKHSDEIKSAGKNILDHFGKNTTDAEGKDSGREINY